MQLILQLCADPDSRPSAASEFSDRLIPHTAPRHEDRKKPYSSAISQILVRAKTLKKKAGIDASATGKSANTPRTLNLAQVRLNKQNRSPEVPREKADSFNTAQMQGISRSIPYCTT